jgi:hypothetical protein
VLASDKREFNLSKPMSAPLPARRVRSTFMSFGFWASTVAFVVIEGDALLDQSEIGHASILFMLGTACLAAGACLALFAIITAIGLAVSAAFGEEPQQQQSAPRQDVPAVAAAHLGQSPSLAPARTKSRSHQQRRPARAVASEVRKAPPPAPGTGWGVEHNGVPTVSTARMSDLS